MLKSDYNMKKHQLWAKTLLNTEEAGSSVLRDHVVLSRDLAVLDCDLRPSG